jgi:hypothetical protein
MFLNFCSPVDENLPSGVEPPRSSSLAACAPLRRMKIAVNGSVAVRR